MTEMKALSVAFDGLARQIDALRREAAGAIVDWRWTKGPGHELVPLWWPRMGLKAGKVIEPPSPVGSAPPKVEGHGYDRDGRVRWGRVRTRVGWNEWVWTPVGGGARIAHFGVPDRAGLAPHPISLMQHDRLGGRLRVASTVGVHGWRQERYHWRRGRVVQVELTSGRALGEPAQEAVIEVERDALGVVQRIVQTAAGASRVVYTTKLPAKGPSKRALLEALTRRLVEATEEAIARAADRGPFSAVALAYDAEPRPMLPFIGLRRAAEQGWNPAEWAIYETDEVLIDDPAAQAALDAWLAVAGARPHKAWRKVLVEVSRRLNGVIDPAGRGLSADWVAYAIDLEGADLRANLESGLSAARFARVAEGL